MRVPRPGAKFFLFLLCLYPLGVMGDGVLRNRLGPDPAQALTLFSGLWTLRFLLLSMSISLVHKFSPWKSVLRYRRMIGLFAFFYGCLHFLAYQLFILQLHWQDLLREILERPYITAGFAAFVLMVPLAITSTNAMVRRLGGRRWKLLHRLIYPAAVLAAAHFLWQARSDAARQLFYILWLLLLLLLRLLPAPRRRPRQPPP